ncbi:hypothetical protein EVAR_8247_1 [Eumeta japonica]|uniref:Uncharacterized protein n=1 Tax=Eumeta variegata TaxID=151549 RepID=A0A4C1TGJ7_EUMVA|nr:hypothetical protein EVAR_8247_1 [Eumeta japonica]
MRSAGIECRRRVTAVGCLLEGRDDDFAPFISHPTAFPALIKANNKSLQCARDTRSDRSALEVERIV